MTDQQQVDLVLEAMQIMAATENPGNLDALLARRGVNPRDLANSILANAKEAKIDPLLLVVMAWIETRFNPKAVSDFINRPQEGKNCGLLQVRTDIPGRPSCEKMMNADENLKWATAHLQELISGCGGELCLKKYNAGDYSDRVWRKLDWLQRKMQWRKV
jgi:soluble lytic murein transglycosylase-like protein